MENVYVKINDIEGEATEKNHVDWIAVKTIAWGVNRTLDQTDLGTSQRGFATCEFNKVTMTSELCKASAKIMTSVANGTAREEIEIHLCRSGDDAARGMEPYLIWKLKDVVIDSYEVDGGEEQIPSETWTLAYRHIEIKYKKSDYRTGKLKDENSFVWNLETGEAG